MSASCDLSTVVLQTVMLPPWVAFSSSPWELPCDSTEGTTDSLMSADTDWSLSWQAAMALLLEHVSSSSAEASDVGCGIGGDSAACT